MARPGKMASQGEIFMEVWAALKNHPYFAWGGILGLKYSLPSDRIIQQAFAV
jgi:hypothetical protein